MQKKHIVVIRWRILSPRWSLILKTTSRTMTLLFATLFLELYSFTPEWFSIRSRKTFQLMFVVQYIVWRLNVWRALINNSGKNFLLEFLGLE
jgi:hypothetical protein